MCARHISPNLSVVVVSANQSVRLEQTLKALRQMDKFEGKLEILYIDRGSNDNSIQIAHNHDAHVIELPATATLGAIHNVGWRTSRGNYILFIDSLGIIHRNFAQKALAKFTDPQIGVICGLGGTRCARCTSSGYVECCEEEAIIRRTAIEEVHGFDKTLHAGDLADLCRRIRANGYKVERIPHPMVDEQRSPNFIKHWWQRCITQGIAYAQVSKRYAASSDKMWLSEARRNFWIGGGLTLAIPALIIASIACACWLPLLVGLAVMGIVTLLMGILVPVPEWNWHEKITYAFSRTVSQVPIFFGQLRYRFFKR